MKKQKRTKIFVTEHLLEVRYDASGSFLNVRGYIADYMKNNNILPHWKIDTNIVNFRDQKDGINNDGAFIGYKSAGYIVYDAQTRSYFSDKAKKFWDVFIANDVFTIPKIVRFGCRTKLFVSSTLQFSDVNEKIFNTVFTNEARTLIDGRETDLQFTIELLEEDFNVRITCGPLHKNEAVNLFQFESPHFKRTGLYLDIDYYKKESLTKEDIASLTMKSIELTWNKAERLASGLGL